MDDYISREAARPDAFCEGVSCQDCPFCKDPIRGGCRIDDFVKSIPAADVVEVRHGRWMSMDKENEAVGMDNDGCPVYSCYCSECGDWLAGSDEYMVHGLYCPSCGAKMDGGQDDV